MNRSSFPNGPFAVPDGFPVPQPVLISVNGIVTDVLLEEYEGKLYAAGYSPPEIWSTWLICEDLAQNLMQECIDLYANGTMDVTKEEVLEHFLHIAVELHWGETRHARWVIRRTAELLDWPAPSFAI